MVEYNTVNAKLSNSQLNESKKSVKNKQGTTLRMNARMFNENNLPHELFLTTRQTTKNFYDQPINDQIKKYDETRKIATEKGDNYATGCLLDYQYFKDHYQLIAVDLSKQKELDANPRTSKQTEFYGKLGTNSQVCTVLEKSKETVLEYSKGTVKVL